MYQESIKGKPERVSPIPGDASRNGVSPMTKQPLPENQSSASLASSAASIARHPLGRGIPPDHEVFK